MSYTKRPLVHEHLVLLGTTATGSYALGVLHKATTGAYTFGFVGAKQMVHMHLAFLYKTATGSYALGVIHKAATGSYALDVLHQAATGSYVIGGLKQSGHWLICNWWSYTKRPLVHILLVVLHKAATG